MASQRNPGGTGSKKLNTSGSPSREMRYENRFRALLEAAPDSLVIVDETGTIVLVNAQTEEMFGYQRRELIGCRVEILIPERLRSRHTGFRAAFAENPRVRPMGAGLDLAARHKDGSEFPVDIRLSPLTVENRNLVSASIRDVSFQKAQEVALKEAREAAELASQAKSRFLAVASHDLRQPVQAAVNYLYVLERQLGPDPPSAFDKLRTAINTHCEQLDRLLDVSRLEMGRVRPEFSVVEVGPFLKSLGDAHRAKAEAKGLELRVYSSSLAVRTDRQLLGQLLQNLIANAIRYTERGRIVLGCRRDARNLRIQVLDTGIGIPEDQLEVIFAEFYQVEVPRADKRRGLGLGLSIVARLSELLDHPLEVRSVVGRGSCFELRVPLAEPTDHKAGSRIARGEASSSGLVVVIDDDEEVLDSITMLLEVSGHQVIAGTSPAAVLGPLRESECQPVLILADYLLQHGCTGPEAIAEVQQAVAREVPAILLTGTSSAEQWDETLTTDYPVLHKPVDPEILMQALADILDA